MRLRDLIKKNKLKIQIFLLNLRSFHLWFTRNQKKFINGGLLCHPSLRYWTLMNRFKSAEILHFKIILNENNKNPIRNETRLRNELRMFQWIYFQRKIYQRRSIFVFKKEEEIDLASTDIYFLKAATCEIFSSLLKRIKLNENKKVHFFCNKRRIT